MALPASVSPPNGFRFETPPGRPFRLISIETEVDGNGSAIASKLHARNIVPSPRVERYGYYPGNSTSCVAYMKKDGSVTGGELVFDKVDLTKPSYAKAMLEAHECLRTLEKEGHIGYNPNCGGHGHVCAHGYGFFDLLRLVVNFGFLEEVIFRLAGAGKTYGHRTLFRGYDRANMGRGYSNPIVKAPFGEIAEAHAKILGMPRMSGLNTTLYATNYCPTGACHTEPLWEGVGRPVHDLKKCTCKKEKHTIEWRVWNSTGNARILYAWIAVMQALHAYSWRPSSSPSYKQYEVLDPLPWTWKPFSRVPQYVKTASQERIEWMFSELPLTPQEKDALRYTFMRTPYKVFGKDWMRRRADLPYKPPPFPNKYTPPIKPRQIKSGVLGEEQPEQDELAQAQVQAIRLEPNNVNIRFEPMPDWDEADFAVPPEVAEAIRDPREERR